VEPLEGATVVASDWARSIAEDELACVVEYVQYGTDASVPNEIQCRQPIDAIGYCSSWPNPELRSAAY
jgi:hypothetical protein